MAGNHLFSSNSLTARRCSALSSGASLTVGRRPGPPVVVRTSVTLISSRLPHNCRPWHGQHAHRMLASLRPLGLLLPAIWSHSCAEALGASTAVSVRAANLKVHADIGRSNAAWRHPSRPRPHAAKTYLLPPDPVFVHRFRVILLVALRVCQGQVAVVVRTAAGHWR